MNFLLLPTAFLLFWYVLFARKNSYLKGHKSLDYSFSLTLLLISILTFLYTEISSVFNALNPTTAKWFWLSALLIALGFSIQKKENLLDAYIQLKNRFSFGAKHPILWFVFLILAINGLLAIYSAPNNFDGHNYHLTRIISWIQNGNVHHYPTRVIQQLYHNVFGEYLVLQTFLLTSGDRLANLIQYLAMLGTLCNISLLSKHFKLSSRARINAIFLMATLTSGIFESSSTQVDYLACFYFTFFVYHLLRIYSGVYQGRVSLAITLTSLVLGLFTKYTIFLYALPFLAFFVLGTIRKKRYKFMLEFLTMGLLLFAIIYLPFWIRNFELFGNFLSPDSTSRLWSESIPSKDFGLRGMLSNLAKNTGLNMGLPLNSFNDGIDTLISKFHNLINIELNTSNYSIDKYFTRFSIQEDMAPNTTHFYLSVASLLFFILGSKKGLGKELLIVTILAFFGVMLTSLLLKFQLWGTRTQMPFFAISVLFSAWFLEEVWAYIKWGLITLILFFAIFVSISNPNKPIVNFKFRVKRALSYAPKVLIPNRIEPIEFQNSELLQWYDIKDEGMFVLESEYQSGKSKKEIFQALDSLGYFDVEKNKTILTTLRAEQYFANDYGIYQDVMALFDSELLEIENVGVYFSQFEGFYNYWAYLNLNKGREVEMKYIRVEKEFKVLANTAKDFSYNYILTDDLDIFLNHASPENIEKVRTSGHLSLVRLKQAQKISYYL